MSSKTLTDHLVQLATPTPYSDAVNHPFLRSAGDGTLSNGLLSLWLSQDRIYAAHAYPRFIGALIASIPFDKSDGLKSAREAQNQRILKTLTFALENIVTEVGFFSETADTWRMELECWRERKGTRDYVAEMDSISRGKQLDDGLVFLWAMERVYLDAWSFVRAELEERGVGHDSPAAAFAKNWSSPEFQRFVNDLAGLVNASKIEWERAERIWARVVELEKDFWPSEREESQMRI
ncbi:heme oxygenase-like protein [Mycena belliarum]|uniref:Heme oxygenase-like protein n=1 Tax=Mycena belliarum TaxID=1033014 RepID=A0AAD6UHB7_9AGAR|nr:heme oxygenase-like protein [Mycena belliae]